MRCLFYCKEIERLFFFVAMFKRIQLSETKFWVTYAKIHIAEWRFVLKKKRFDEEEFYWCVFMWNLWYFFLSQSQLISLVSSVVIGSEKTIPTFISDDIGCLIFQFLTVLDTCTVSRTSTRFKEWAYRSLQRPRVIFCSDDRELINVLRVCPRIKQTLPVHKNRKIRAFQEIDVCVSVSFFQAQQRQLAVLCLQN